MKNWSIISLLSVFIFLSDSLFAQYDPVTQPNTYTSIDNPNYWKNKKPYEGYWQQDVHYTINATIDETTDIVSGVENLIYTNNSPHTLKKVYFHLYQNAFQPGSYYDQYQRAQGIKPKYGRYESQKLGTTIKKISIATEDSVYTKVKTELDNTILIITLPEPIAPNASVVFDINFKTYYDAGTVRRRMKVFNAYKIGEPNSKTDPNYNPDLYANKHYDGVHWYPRICVYDNKFGWNTNQHLGREFYGDFGTFDVSLNFASNFVVEATGALQNREEVLPDSLAKQLDIKKFADKPWNEIPSIITPYNSNERKTWRYHAENVHDFAFTADPTYRIGTNQYNGVETISLAREHRASGWQNAADYAAKIIKVFSNDIGEYVWNKIIVADAKDGMEYPMLTLDGGTDPGHRGLLVHEIGHMWFFGMIGTNETYRAALDEGFTQFLTVYGLEAIEGKYIPRNEPANKFLAKYKDPQITLDRRAYGAYLADAKHHNDPALNIHSNHYKSPSRGYRHVYYKTATMLYNLQYVLGDDLFLGAMQHYFNTWKIAHPYFDDFKKSITDYTKVDLNWFFDQWIEAEGNIDYAIKKVKQAGEDGTARITFERKGEMVMPLDVKLVLADSSELDIHIPNTYFIKKSDADMVLPKWTSFNFLNNTYTAEVPLRSKIKAVIIDPSNRLADVNMLNNRTSNIFKFELDHQLYEQANRYAYDIKWRPALWYNAYDGVKLGARFNGGYFGYKHLVDAGVFLNTTLAKFTFTDHALRYGERGDNDLFSVFADYKTSIDKVLPNSYIMAGYKHLDGLNAAYAGVSTVLAKKHKIGIRFKSMIRKEEADLNYLINPTEWAVGKRNNVLDLTYNYNYRISNSLMAGSGAIEVGLRTSSLFSDSQYQYGYLNVVNKLRKSKIDARTRVYIQAGGGNAPAESALFLAGANNETLMDNKYTRSLAFRSMDVGGFGPLTNHFHNGGGLNLRGYSGYLVADRDTEITGDQVFAYKGNSGWAINAEVEFDKYISPFIPKNKWLKPFSLDAYWFFDIGALQYTLPDGKKDFTDIRFDTGVGAALTIKKWWLLEKVKPLTIRFDVPLIVNHRPFDESFIKLRWVLGINRAF